MMPRNNNEEVPSFKLANVMLIDDSRIDNFIHQKLLESNRFSQLLQVYRRAQKALDYLTAAAYGNEEKIPELILLDIKMPGMDGFEFLEEFAKLPDSIHRRTRVIILSSYSLKKHELERIKDENPNVIFSIDKPLIPKDLQEIRKALIKHRRFELARSA